MAQFLMYIHHRQTQRFNVCQMFHLFQWYEYRLILLDYVLKGNNNANVNTLLIHHRNDIYYEKFPIRQCQTHRRLFFKMVLYGEKPREN